VPTVVKCVVSFAAVAEAEVAVRCKTTKGVVERRFEHDAELVNVSR
jgi:hypothetical protein